MGAGSKRTYKTGEKFWIKYTKAINVDKFTDDPDTIINFVVLRFLEYKCGKQAIMSNLSHINSFRTKNGYKPIKWSEHCWKLPYIYQVIDKCRPPGPGSKPNDEAFTKRLKKHYNLSNFTHLCIWTSNVLAYSFALRCCEYAETKEYHPPKLANLKLVKTQLDTNSILYILPFSKANQLGTEPEVLQTVCCCPRICAYCNLILYLDARLKIHDQIPKKYRDCLFVYKKKVRKRLKNGKFKVIFVWHPLKASVVRSVFAKIVTKEFGKNHGHTVHGWRSGGITDLIAMGLSREAVSALSRHAENSNVFQRYIRFIPEHACKLIKGAKS